MDTIVVGVDGSEESKHALQWAFEEAALRGARLRVVHGWRLPTVGLGAPLLWEPTPEAEAKLRQERLDWLEALVHEIVGENPDVEIAADVIEDYPAQALIEAAQEAKILVVGSRGHGGFTELLVGSVSHQCIHHAPCTVVVVR
jgi:nucleotide-binding universal stress UspA family protein